jgi:hypothetical protein
MLSIKRTINSASAEIIDGNLGADMLDGAICNDSGIFAVKCRFEKCGVELWDKLKAWKRVRGLKI